MKNTFTNLDRQYHLVLILTNHRQVRLPGYSDKKWNAMKMQRYRLKRELQKWDFDAFSFDKLRSRCLYVNPRNSNLFFLREVKGCDLNKEVTRMMKQILRGRD